jgi:hypothetical protein
MTEAEPIFEELEEVTEGPEETSDIQIDLEGIDLTDVPPQPTTSTNPGNPTNPTNPGNPTNPANPANPDNDPEMVNVSNHREDRRALCQKLESDPEFRQQYIQEVAEKQKTKTQELLDKIKRMEEGKEPISYPLEEDDGPSPLPDDDDNDDSPILPRPSHRPSSNQVYIHKVKKLVINL